MSELFTGLNFWHWLVFGAALMAMETIIPGAFFLWPGLAAVLVGILTLAVPSLDWTISLTLWAALSILTMVLWVLYRRKHPAKAAENTLNRRGQEYVGQQFTLAQPVVNGKGELKAGDTVWRVTASTDLPAGALVRVIAIDGTSLRVESA